VKNIKTRALRSRRGKNNESTLEFKEKWSIYNVLKDETQKQLKKYHNHKHLCRPPNDQNRIAIDFAKSNYSNKSFQIGNNYNVQNDISINTINNLQNLGENKQGYQTHTFPILLDEIRKKEYNQNKNFKHKYYDANEFESKFTLSSCKQIIIKDNNNIKDINQKQLNRTRHILNGVHNSKVNLYIHNFTLNKLQIPS